MNAVYQAEERRSTTEKMERLMPMKTEQARNESVIRFPQRCSVGFLLAYDVLSMCSFFFKDRGPAAGWRDVISQKTGNRSLWDTLLLLLQAVVIYRKCCNKKSDWGFKWDSFILWSAFDLSAFKNVGLSCLQGNFNIIIGIVMTSSIIINAEAPGERWEGIALQFSHHGKH